jgi:hypothetical protein
VWRTSQYRYSGAIVIFMNEQLTFQIRSHRRHTMHMQCSVVLDHHGMSKSHARIVLSSNIVTKLLAVVEELDVPDCIDVSAEGAEAVALGVDDPDLTAKCT